MFGFINFASKMHYSLNNSHRSVWSTLYNVPMHMQSLQVQTDLARNRFDLFMSETSRWTFTHHTVNHLILRSFFYAVLSPVSGPRPNFASQVQTFCLKFELKAPAIQKVYRFAFSGGDVWMHHFKLNWNWKPKINFPTGLFAHLESRS